MANKTHGIRSVHRPACSLILMTAFSVVSEALSAGDIGTATTLSSMSEKAMCCDNTLHTTGQIMQTST